MDDVSEQYSLEFAELPDWLQVTVRADVWTPAMADDYNLRVAEKMEGSNAERVLIVRDIPVTLHSLAVFQLMTEFVEGVGRRKVAVVNPFPALREDLEFAVGVATNRRANYKLFENVADAEAWLRG